MSREPELLDLTKMPVEQLFAMKALLTDVEAIARGMGPRSRSIADGLADEIKRYKGEIARRSAAPCLRLVIDNGRRA